MLACVIHMKIGVCTEKLAKKMAEIKDRIIVNPLHNKQGTNSNHTHTQYWMC